MFFPVAILKKILPTHLQKTHRIFTSLIYCILFFVVLITLHADPAESGNRTFLTYLYGEIYRTRTNNSEMLTFSKRFLLNLALIRLALMLNKTAEEVKKMCDFPSIKSFAELTTDEGVAADWAFTILDYVFAIHCRLIKVDADAAYLLRNFLFKNFAFKLRGCKRVCVMATLFAGLCYDVESMENTHTRDIINIGEYVLTKFVTEKYLGRNVSKTYPEFRVYVCFVCIFMADLYKHFDFNVTPLLNAAKEFQATHAGYISEFVKVILMAIEKGMFKKRSEYQNEFLLKKNCSERWKAAIVLPRIFDDDCRTPSTARWANRITLLEEKKGLTKQNKG